MCVNRIDGFDFKEHLHGLTHSMRSRTRLIRNDFPGQMWKWKRHRCFVRGYLGFQQREKTTYQKNVPEWRTRSLAFQICWRLCLAKLSLSHTNTRTVFSSINITLQGPCSDAGAVCVWKCVWDSSKISHSNSITRGERIVRCQRRNVFCFQKLLTSTAERLDEPKTSASSSSSDLLKVVIKRNEGQSGDDECKTCISYDLRMLEI